MPAHLPFHFFYPSIRIPARTAKTPPSPRSWGLGAPNPSQRHRLAALSPPARGVGGASAWSQSTPSPQTPQAASPCSWACRRQLPPPPHSERKEAPKPPTLGAWVRQPSANGLRHCGPPAHGVGVRLHGAKAPRLPKRRRRQAPARGLAAVNSHHHPIRNETQNARPLLVGRAFVYFEPTALAGRTAARRSSMRAGSSVSSISKPVS